MGTIAHVQVGAERERARRAHRERRWTDAVDAFVGVDEASPLDVEDLERLAEALDLVGRGGDAVAALERAYAARVDAEDVGAALRDAFWLWRALAFNAEFAHAGAWIARAGRLAEAQADCTQHGYLLLPDAERELRDGDYGAAFATAGRAAGCGERCGDHDLVTIGRHLQGRALVGQGRVAAGLVLLRAHGPWALLPAELWSALAGVVAASVVVGSLRVRIRPVGPKRRRWAAITSVGFAALLLLAGVWTA